MSELIEKHFHVVTALKLTLQEYYQRPFDELDEYRYDEDSGNYFLGDADNLQIVVRVMGEQISDNFDDCKESHDIYEVFGLTDDFDNTFTIRFEEENEYSSGLSRRISFHGEIEDDITTDIEMIFWEKYADFH